MAIPTMTVRNLTSTPIHIKHYETLESQHDGHGVGHLKNLTSLWSTPANVPPPQSTLEDVSIVLAPLEIGTANIRPAKLPQQTVNIVFEINGELYQTNIIKPTIHTQILLPLTPNAPRTHSTVYHPEQHHLTILSYSHPSTWMQSIRDTTPLSALSIPGTHNSPTHHRALPSVRCQVQTIPTQLTQGVRFLDIRVQPEHPLDPTKETLNLVHGVFPISLTGPKHFRPVIASVLTFLSQNPSETILMSVKREGPGSATDAQLSLIMHSHYANDTTKWFTAPRIPTLAEARGKIVLIRRFALDDSLKSEHRGQGWCINADTWADNTPNSLCPSGDLCIQDFYEVLEAENIEKKIQYSIDHLKRAAECVRPAPGSETKMPFFVNFLTASNFWKQSCWPDKIAKKLNPAVVEFLCRRHGAEGAGDGSTGVVVCDWIGEEGDWSLVECILGFNTRFMDGGVGQVTAVAEEGKKENVVP